MLEPDTVNPGHACTKFWYQEPAMATVRALCRGTPPAAVTGIILLGGGGTSASAPASVPSRSRSPALLRQRPGAGRSLACQGKHSTLRAGRRRLSQRAPNSWAQRRPRAWRGRSLGLQALRCSCLPGNFGVRRCLCRLTPALLPAHSTGWLINNYLRGEKRWSTEPPGVGQCLLQD